MFLRADRRGADEEPVAGTHDLRRDVLEVKKPRHLVERALRLEVRLRLALLQDRGVDPEWNRRQCRENGVPDRLRVGRCVKHTIQVRALPSKVVAQLGQGRRDRAAISSDRCDDEVARSAVPS